jgi:hypothetical protein
MKKILLSIAVLAMTGNFAKVQSQCIVSNLGVNVKSYNSTTCQVNFDLTWEQEVNNGNKFAYVHLWTGANYHTPAANWAGMYSNPAAFPQAADLANALATISIFNNGTATPGIGITYPPDDPAVTPLSAGLTVVKTPLPGGIRERMTVFNITLTLASCSGVVTIKGDVWASQSANGKNVHCASQGLIFNLNNPRVIGFKVCNPRSVTFGITNNDPSTTITVYYNLYKDDGDGFFEPGTGSGLDGAAILTSGSISIDPLATYSEVQLGYPGSNVSGETGSLWIEVTTTVPAFSFVVIGKLQDPGCSPLPVEFKLFTAVRNHSNVFLAWETASERNTNGFAVERNVSGIWEQVVFIPSQAANGNSDVILNYQYTDLNNTNGITQYRIKLVDLDKKSKYSEIRSVRGEGQLGKTIVYPNPSKDGRVNIVFEEANVRRDISVMDMSGRIMRQIRNISNSNITLDNLVSGIYILRIINIETGEQLAEKIMVNR